MIWACVAWSGFATAAESTAMGKTQRLTSPDQTPTGLPPSDWASIRSALTASHHPFAQQAYLKASQVDDGDRFGHSVGVSGDTVVVGAPFEGSSTEGVNSTPNELAGAFGAAYVYVRSGTNWTQQAYLKASQVSRDDWFGYSVAISGDTVVVGAIHEDSSTTGINSTPDEAYFNAGAAYVFVRNGTNWTQQAYLKASQVSETDEFGRSVAVSGDTVVVGAFEEDSSTTGINSTPNEDAANAGAAYVFVRHGTNWTQQAYLKAHQVSAGDEFGASVAVSDDTVAVGAQGDRSGTTGINSIPNEGARKAGAAYVFVRHGTNWTQQAYLKAHQVSAEDQFGWSVAVSGDTVVVGAISEDSSTTGVNRTADEGAADAGAAYVFVRRGTNWSQQAYLKASQVTAGDQFGFSVAVTGDTVIVGANGEDSSATGINRTPDESAANTGAAYVFTRSGPTWSERAYLKASHVTANDRFGSSGAVSGDLLVVGAHEEDSTTAGINSRPNQLGSEAGATFVFSGLGSLASAPILRTAVTEWSSRPPAWPRRAVAVSHDGQRLVAAGPGETLHVSTDGGANWIPSATARDWTAVASSADGSRLTAAVANGPLFHSADAGATWAEIASARAWSGLASAADGLRLAAVVDGGPLLLSTNAGATWTSAERNRFWKGIASSADGRTLAAIVEDGPLLISTDGGTTWVSRAEPKPWTSVAASADGSVLVASVWDGPILVSSDSGLTWNVGAPDRFWHAVSCSADGRHLIAAETLGRVYVSTDSGLNWTEHLENRDWAAVAWSGDGKRVVAAVREGPLFVSSAQRMPIRVTVPARSEPASFPGFAAALDPAAAGPPDQLLRWSVACANPELFRSAPALDPAGDLTFIPAGRPGLARITVTPPNVAGAVGEPQVFEIELTEQKP